MEFDRDYQDQGAADDDEKNDEMIYAFLKKRQIKDQAPGPAFGFEIIKRFFQHIKNACPWRENIFLKKAVPLREKDGEKPS